MESRKEREKIAQLMSLVSFIPDGTTLMTWKQQNTSRPQLVISCNMSKGVQCLMEATCSCMSVILDNVFGVVVKMKH